MDALAREGYSFWTGRLAQAAKFYGAYRIDHVLGFFRIWALPEREESGPHHPVGEGVLLLQRPHDLRRGAERLHDE